MNYLIDQFQSSSSSNSRWTFQPNHAVVKDQIVELIIYFQFKSILNKVGKEAQEVLNIILEYLFGFLDYPQFAITILHAVTIDDSNNLQSLVLILSEYVK